MRNIKVSLLRGNVEKIKKERMKARTVPRKQSAGPKAGKALKNVGEVTMTGETTGLSVS